MPNRWHSSDAARVQSSLLALGSAHVITYALGSGADTTVLKQIACDNAGMLYSVADNANLDWFSPGQSKHPVFGAIKDQASFDIVVAISKVQTRNDNPVTPIMMKSITIS